MIKVGDKVKSVNNDESHGKNGIVIGEYMSTIMVVKFDDFEGHGHRHYGEWNVDVSALKKIKKKKKKKKKNKATYPFYVYGILYKVSKKPT